MFHRLPLAAVGGFFACSTVRAFEVVRNSLTTHTYRRCFTTSRGETYPASACHASPRLGGDFAGYFATYDKEGILLPVPEYLVPKDLLEWDAAPPALEVLVSEAESTETKTWTRQELKVLPATGCGVDNLEVLKRVEQFPLSDTSVSFKTSADEAKPVRSFIYPLESPKHHMTRVETIFASALDDHRCRLVVDLASNESSSSWTLLKPLSVFVERQNNQESSHGKRADGGGLDGRSVFQWIGPTLRREFDQSLGKRELRQWQRVGGDESNHWSDQVVLPGNVTLACGSNDETNRWVLQVGHVYPEEGVRRVVQQTWACDESAWSVKTWIEEGTFEAL
jgi:hypothetical protein